MEKESRYQFLLNKYLSDQCSPDEADELLGYLRLDESKRLLLESMRPEFEHAMSTQQAVPGEMSRRIEERLKDRTGTRVVSLRKKQNYAWLKGAAAAAIILILSGGVYWFLNEARNIKGKTAGVMKNDFGPGENKAMLTLGDGTKIALDEARKGVIATQGNISIQKSADGRITYRYAEAGPGPVNPGGAMVFNFLETPKGGQYHVILPDGTKVWLNAASSLRFPAEFTGGSRTVELKGEAYFEVAKNKNMPFLVDAGDAEVEVLGTGFNLAAYGDEDRLTTTLVEGLVKVKEKGMGKDIILKPGYKAILDKGSNTFNVDLADTEEAVAWKNGYFMFANEEIESVMRKIGRWYNVDIEYRGDVAGKKLWGTISKFENVSEVLKALELTRVVHFKIEGRRIIVMT